MDGGGVHGGEAFAREGGAGAGDAANSGAGLLQRLPVKREASTRSRLGSTNLGIESIDDVLKFAEVMAKSDFMVPAHLRNNTGACAGVILQALRWGMEPFSLAQQTYLTETPEKINGRETGVTLRRLEYKSAVLTAVINTMAPITGNISYRFEGSLQNGTRKCFAYVMTTWGELREVATPELRAIPDNMKRSTNYKSNPDQQLAYVSGKMLARRDFPEILLGVRLEGDDYDEEIEIGQKPFAPGADSADRGSAGVGPSGAVGSAQAGGAPDETGEQGQASKAKADDAKAKNVREPMRHSNWDSDAELRVRKLCGQARNLKAFAACRASAAESFGGPALSEALRLLQLEETRAEIHPNRLKRVTELIEQAKTERTLDAFEAIRTRSRELAKNGQISETELSIYLMDIRFGEIDAEMGTQPAQMAA